MKLQLADGQANQLLIESYQLAGIYINKVFGLTEGKKDFTDLWQNIKAKMISAPGWYIQSFNDSVKNFFGRVQQQGGVSLSYNWKNNFIIAEITYREKSGSDFVFTVREIASSEFVDIITISPDSKVIDSKNGYNYKQVPAMVNVQQPKIIVADVKRATITPGGDGNGTPAQTTEQNLPWLIYAAGAFLIYKVLK